MTKTSRLGTTLVELLIYSVLLILILGAIYASYGIARDYYSAAQVETQTQQAALDAGLSVSQELNQACAKALVSSDTPSALLFLSAKTDSGLFEHDATTGELLWQRWVCIYLDTQNNQLLCVESKLVPSTTTPPETIPTVDSLIQNTALPRRVLARDISEFSHQITGSSTVIFGVRSTTVPIRMPSGQSMPAGSNNATEMILSTEVPIRQ